MLASSGTGGSYFIPITRVSRLMWLAWVWAWLWAWHDLYVPFEYALWFRQLACTVVPLATCTAASGRHTARVTAWPLTALAAVHALTEQVMQARQSLSSSRWMRSP